MGCKGSEVRILSPRFFFSKNTTVEPAKRKGQKESNSCSCPLFIFFFESEACLDLNHNFYHDANYACDGTSKAT